MNLENFDMQPEEPETDTIQTEYTESTETSDSPPCPVWKNKRSDNMAAASFILGITALLTSGFIYFSIVCGSLGIILALLSRGGEYTMSRHAKLGLVLNILGLFFTIVIFVGILAFILYHFGGIEGFMQEYMNIMGVDSMEALYEMLGITY